MMSKTPSLAGVNPKELRRMRAEMHNFFRYEEEKKEMENEIAHLKSQFVALE